MGNPRLALSEFLLAMGRPGLAGAVLLVLGAAYGAAVLLPGQGELQSLRERADRADARVRALRSGSAPAPAVPPAQAFYATLADSDALNPQVERIYAAAAAEQLLLLQGDYARSEVAGTRLLRYRIALPVRGSYAQVRRFAAAATTEVPGLVLDEVSLKRKSVAEAQVEARVQFSLFLARR
jgi:hypothetical protein